MNSTTSYRTAKQQIINQFNSAEHGIFLLEQSIEERPTASRALNKKDGFIFYEKSAFIIIFDTLMYKKDSITIRYALHIQTNEIILIDIF